MVYIIVNKTAKTGKGSAVWSVVKNFLEENNIEYKAFQTKYAGHANVLAKNISSLPDERVTLLVLGGDGTVNEVVNGIADFDKVEMAVIPCGSGNDFARGVGISKNVYDNLANIFYDDRAVKVDLGLVKWEDNERLFVISSGVGMDAIVCKKALTSKIKVFLNKLGLGKLTYIIITLQTLLSMKKIGCKLSMDGKEKHLSQLIFTAAMNLRAEGGGVPMAPHADLSDGHIDICAAYGINRFASFLILPFLVLAKHEKLSCFYTDKFKECNIELEEPFTLHADGEYLGEVDKLTYSIAPHKLKMRGIN